MPGDELLSPIHLVELGRRITRDTAEAVGVADLIDDARLVVQRGLRSLAAAAATLGMTEQQLKQLAFREPVYSPYRWGTRDPRLSPQSSARYPLPEPRSVLYGRKQLPAATPHYAFVYQEGAAVLLFEESDWGHASYNSLSDAVGYSGDKFGFWKTIGTYPDGARLLT